VITFAAEASCVVLATAYDLLAHKERVWLLAVVGDVTVPSISVRVSVK
jgi:hypothetical protein